MLIPGYHGVFLNHEDSCMLRVSIAHKAVNSQTILDWLKEMLMKNNFDKATIEAELNGKQLITKYFKLMIIFLQLN